MEAGVPSPSHPLAQAIQKPKVFIGDHDAIVVFAGLTPGLAGVYQVNAIVPDALVPACRPDLYAVEWHTADNIATTTGIIAVK